MNQAINAYYTITASSEFRERERLFDKARHDEAQALRHARLEERVEIARNLKSLGLPAEQIARGTGLSLAEIEELGRQP